MQTEQSSPETSPFNSVDDVERSLKNSLQTKWPSIREACLALDHVNAGLVRKADFERILEKNFIMLSSSELDAVLNKYGLIDRSSVRYQGLSSYFNNSDDYYKNNNRDNNN